MKLSLCFGTLNRVDLLSEAINKTLAEADKYNLDVEIVAADGGSDDGTIEWLKSKSNEDNRIRPLFLNGRSPYPDFMNRAIKHSSGHAIVQWNDDAFMCPGGWKIVSDAINKNKHNKSIAGFRFPHISEEIPACDSVFTMEHPQWQRSVKNMTGWKFMCFGIYYRRIFRKYGLYHPNVKFYHCDTEMCRRVIAMHGPKSMPFLLECRVHHVKSSIERKNQTSPSGEADRRRGESISAWIRKNKKIPNEVELL